MARDILGERKLEDIIQKLFFRGIIDVLNDRISIKINPALKGNSKKDLRAVSNSLKFFLVLPETKKLIEDIVYGFYCSIVNLDQLTLFNKMLEGKNQLVSCGDFLQLTKKAKKLIPYLSDEDIIVLLAIYLHDRYVHYYTAQIMLLSDDKYYALFGSVFGLTELNHDSKEEVVVRLPGRLYHFLYFLKELGIDFPENKPVLGGIRIGTLIM